VTVEYLDANKNAQTVKVGLPVSVSSATDLMTQTEKHVTRVSHYDQLLFYFVKRIIITC